MKSRLENSIWFMLIFPWVRLVLGLFVGNSSSIITDLGTAAATALSTASTARAIAAAGPIVDAPGLIKSILLNFQEAQEKLNYLLGGAATSPASLTAPAGGIITTGDDAVLYPLLVSVFQMLK